MSSIGGDANVAGTTAGGASTLACREGETPCAGTCANTKSDRANCGACGTPCEGYQFCADGKCLPTYVSTRVQPGDATVISAAVSKDKAQGDLLLELLAGEGGITVSSASSIQQRAFNDVVLAKYTADGMSIWGRTMAQLFPPTADPWTASAMFLASNNDLYIGYRHVGPSNPGGTPITPRLAKISGSNNPSVIWNVPIPQGGVPRQILPRWSSGDFITLGEEPDPVAHTIPSSVCRFVDQSTTATYSCIAPCYASGAIVGSDGSTVWMWGRYDGTRPLNPWSSQEWSNDPNPAPASNTWAWPDSFLIGTRDDGTTVGPWMSEGDSGPAWKLAVSSQGHIVATVAGTTFSTFNGGQTLLGDSPAALIKITPSNGQIVWRRSLQAVPTGLVVGAPDRIIVLYENKNGAPYTITIHADATGEQLSQISAGLTTYQPTVLALGQTELFVIGNTNTLADFDPSTATDLHGSTPGVFISRYSF